MKETKRRDRPRKDQKKSGRSHHEEDLPTRRRDDSDSTDEGEGKANDGKSRPGNGNGTGKHGSDREPSKTGTSRALIPKGQNSCSNAMARKAPTGKSVARRVRPILKTVSELAVVSPSPMPAMASTSSEAPPLNTTVGRVEWGRRVLKAEAPRS